MAQSKSKKTTAKGQSKGAEAAKKPPAGKKAAAAGVTAVKAQKANWSVRSVRDAWISYFKSKNHEHVASASLIPAGDPTLLFTTAGMVQFKPYFAGTQTPAFGRAATIQKCLRTTDLESVGRTERHCTFFEMLGNFSFGDYFKTEAIHFAWEFSVDVLKLNPEKIYITVYQDDDDAVKLWNKEIGVPLNRITRLGKEHNWWGPAGSSGACGPCSELYLDRGVERCTCEDKSSCAPGSSCDRFMEYWNLVFNEFNQDVSGKLHPLPKKGIDTGAGLERLSALLGGLDSVYDTDEMAAIIRLIEAMTGEFGVKGRISYEKKSAPPFRVMTDHIRAASFAVADGVLPDNTGRGYVVRRILRRGLLFARELGLTRPVLNTLVPSIVEIYGSYYPELVSRQKDIERIILQEEERFLKTLETGLKKWSEFLAEHREAGKKVFGGFEIFMLYDTYGFPHEMTCELAEKEGLSVDLDGYHQHMEKQRAQSASFWKEIDLPDMTGLGESVFTGYDHAGESSTVASIVAEGKIVTSLSRGEKGMFILNTTPFYPEGGGQIGDTGQIRSSSGAVFQVQDTRKKDGYILHMGEVLEGAFKKGESVHAEIDPERRQNVTFHHSATHLLNRALREVLGNHILQTGSLVAGDYLRFDFSHSEKIPEDRLRLIEARVNDAIRASADVSARILPIEEARKTGAMATFGEKYGEEVRVITMGDNGRYSIEFCGGCHVKNTGDIKYFHILKESSPGAGNRRIEALAGESVPAFFEHEFQTISVQIQEFNEKLLQAAGDNPELKKLIIADAIPGLEEIRSLLSRDTGALSDRLARLQALLKEREKEFFRIQKQKSADSGKELLSLVDETIAGAQKAGSVSFVIKKFESQEMDNLRKFGDALKEKHRSIALLFGNVTDKGPALIFMANKGATDAGVNCGSLISKAAEVIGGRGGGRPDMAQAGGKTAEKLDEALKTAGELLAASLK